MDMDGKVLSNISFRFQSGTVYLNVAFWCKELGRLSCDRWVTDSTLSHLSIMLQVLTSCSCVSLISSSVI